MAFVHEIKFFKQEDSLFCALFEAPSRHGADHWIKNVPASDLGIDKVPENISLEQKYRLEVLGIKPFFFYKTVPKFEFINTASEFA